MVSGKPSSRGDYNPVTAPDRFNKDLSTVRLNSKNTSPQLKIYTSQSNSSGSTVYSDPIRIAPAEGFSVYVSGTGDVEVQTCVSPQAGSWFTQTTITNSGIYSTTSPLRWLRIGLADGASSMNVWVFRKYVAY